MALIKKFPYVIATDPAYLLAGGYVPNEGPVIEYITPTHGPDTGGNTVSIFGGRFTGATRVRFANSLGVSGTDPFVVISDSEIQAQPSADLLDELVKVFVVTPKGTATLNAAYKYDGAGGAPVLSSMNYSQGDPLGGGASIVLTGSGFTGATVTSIGTDASFVVDSDTQITATLPAVVIGGMPDFDGTDDYLVEPVANNVVFSATALSFFCLFYADTAPTTTGSGYQDGNLFTDIANAENVIGFTNLGFGASFYDGAFKEVRVACSTGAWHLGQVKLEGGLLKVRVDNGAWSSTPCGALSFLTPSASCSIGRGYAGGLYFDGRTALYGASDTALSDANFDNVLAFVYKKYGINLGVAASAFDPASLALTLYYQAGDYKRGKWKATASAGSSAGDDATQSGATITPKRAFADKPGLGAGTYNVSVTSPGGTSNTLPFEFWSPAQLALTLWLRDYEGGTWLGETSAGTSGVHDIPSGATDPAVGSLNGYGTAVFNGTTSKMTMSPLTLADVAGTGGTNWANGAVFKTNNVYTQAAPPGAYPYDDPAFIINSDGIWGISHTTQGGRVWGYDSLSGSGGYVIAATSDPGAGTWHTLQGRCSGTNVYAKLDAAAPVDGGTVNAGWGGESTSFVNYVGTRYTFNAPLYDGDLAELFAADADVLAGGNDVKIQKYTAQRYAI